MADTKAITAVLQRAIDAGEVPGVVAAAAAGGATLFSGGFGTRNAATGEPMTADTVVWIASMTKAVTGACAMQLVEQGRLSLDGPISSVLPELASVRVLDGFDASGAPRLRSPKRDITLRHLLTHTSGYVYDMWNSDMARYMEKTGTPGIISCQNAALAIPLTFDPGDRWDYGIGIDWAGKAVEAVSGMKLGRYMQLHMFDPLGMNDTRFRIGEAQRRRLGRIHVRRPNGFAATDTEIPQEPEFEMGGGGLYSTVGDYLKFTQMVLGKGTLNGTRVLAPETVEMMSRNAMGELVCRPMKTAAPGYTNDVDFIDGMKWGLSFLINPAPLQTGRSAGSLAWAGLANSYFWIDPTRQVAGVYAAQLLPFADSKALPLFQAFEAAVYQSK